MLGWRIFYRDERTGGAWWPLEPIMTEPAFSNTDYKIFEVTYTTDSAEFRKARSKALRETMWETIGKKP